MYALGHVPDIVRMDDFARHARKPVREERFVRSDERDLEMMVERYFQGEPQQRDTGSRVALRNL
jgi:hypothetical protein